MGEAGVTLDGAVREPTCLRGFSKEMRLLLATQRTDAFRLPFGEGYLSGYSLSGMSENRLIFAAIKGSASAKTAETTLPAEAEG